MMSMMWMRMPGQTWLDVATSFLGVWTAMMAAMMLPSLVPMLIRYRRAVRGIGSGQLHVSTALIGAGYFGVWTLAGAAVFLLGVTLAAIEMRQPALASVAPIATGLTVVAAGAMQFTAWKARELSWCKEPLDHHRTATAGARAAWRHGLCLGLHCGASCAGLMAILLVIGMMDLRAMALVTAAITVERLAPTAFRAERAIGAIGVGAGVILIALATSTR
jgi:predicted metal-binding membrane protein